MDRYNDPSATPGGEFTDGDPQLDLPRTLLRAQWPNMMQRELVNLVQGAGLQLDASDFTQVLQAVVSLAGSNGFVTGDIKYSYRPAPPPGWLTLDGRTIGPAGSGATALAGSEAQALYTFLWDTFSDVLAPVSGGRGASAQADWDAGKSIRLFDDRGEFHRVHDAGRGIDIGRGLATTQLDQMQRITGQFRGGRNIGNGIEVDGAFSILGPASNTGTTDNTGNQFGFDSGDSPGARVGPDTRPRNRAVSAFIKL